MDQAFTGQGELRVNFGVRLFGLAIMELTCTSSYFVAPNSINRVLAVLKAELDAGPRMPLDLCLRAAADDGALNKACTIPFLTSVRLESIVRGTIVSPQECAAGLDLALQSLLRYFFFIKRNLQGYAMPHLRQMADPHAARNSHHQFMASILSSILAGTNR